MKTNWTFASFFAAALLLATSVFAGPFDRSMTRPLVFDDASDTVFQSQRVTVYERTPDTFYTIPYMDQSSSMPGLLGSVTRSVVFDPQADMAFMDQREVLYSASSDTVFTAPYADGNVVGRQVRTLAFDEQADTAFMDQREIAYNASSDTVFSTPYWNPKA